MTRNHITLKLRAAVAICAIVIPLVLPATGFAQTLTLAKAHSLAAAEANVIKRQTGAISSTVVACSRQTSLRVTCKVRSRYSSGLSKCVTNVIVYYKSRSSTRARSLIGGSVCS